MKVAVTAANGKLGSALIKQLTLDIGKNHVIGIARTPDQTKHPGIEIRKGDYNSKEDFVRALDGIDAVLLVSGMDHPDKRIEQHRNVIHAARDTNVKKIVYTSIIGPETGSAFSPVVRSNRKTEEDIRNSGLDWVIGRNGLYIEPDLEYIDNYVARGEVFNSAGEGKCVYTSRKELAVAYSKMLLDNRHNGQTYHLAGTAISQTQLVEYINELCHTRLVYRPASVEEYTQERKNELGEFLGTIIGGIYEGIRDGAFNVESDFFNAAGRPHKSPPDMIQELL